MFITNVIAEDWNWTADLWYWKRPLCHLGHCPVAKVNYVTGGKIFLKFKMAAAGWLLVFKKRDKKCFLSGCLIIQHSFQSLSLPLSLFHIILSHRYSTIHSLSLVTHCHAHNILFWTNSRFPIKWNSSVEVSSSCKRVPPRTHSVI